MTRKPGDLLDAVWVGIFRRKKPVRRLVPLYGGGLIWVRLRLAFFGGQVFFCGEIE